MPYKIERWSNDLLAPPDALRRQLGSLSDRELVIVACALLDSALAELLSDRLLGTASELEEFLGLNNDSRAPAGTFGARILLARLTGMLESGDIAVLRRLKAIRNEMAHRVNASLSGTRAVALTASLKKAMDARVIAFGGKPDPPKVPARDLIIRVTDFYQRIFRTFHGRFERLPKLILKKRA